MCQSYTSNNTTTTTTSTTTTTTSQHDFDSDNDIIMTLAPSHNSPQESCYDNELIRELGRDTRLQLPSTGCCAPADQVVTPGKITLLYFSAYWCGPCKKVTPMLKEWYQTIKMQGSKFEDFEMIYVSLDAFEKEYSYYTREMPWWCLPFNSPMAGKLSRKYNTTGAIPTLVVIDANGQVLCQDAVPLIAGGSGCQFPWRPKPITQLLPEYYLKNNQQLPMRDLADKHLLIFAGGSWCEPCRNFAQRLGQAYQRLMQQRNDFEILYLSSDLDERTFHDFHSSMPFGAIPFEHREAKMAIASKYNISRIPTVLVLGPVGENGTDRPLINADARAIFEEPESAYPRYLQEFPYAPKRFGDLNRATQDINSTKAVVVFCEYCDDCEQEDIEEAMQCASSSYGGDLKFLWVHEPTPYSQALRSALNIAVKGSNQSLSAFTKPRMVLLDFANEGTYYLATDSNDCDEDVEITTQGILEFAINPGTPYRVM